MKQERPPEFVIASELSENARRKLEVIQSLLEPCDRSTYGQRLRQGAQQLGISMRSVQRLFKKYQEYGLAALTQTERADKGLHRISSFWQEFIIKTYKEGNQGSRRTTPKQVAIKVQVKAREIEDVKPPNYRTVLRVLDPIVQQQEKRKSIRSPGWRGDRLAIKTRDGEQIEVTHSNQAWQCDHTTVDVRLVDRFGQPYDRPCITTVIDSYSRCIMGINLGFDAESSQVVALALRHAILPKNYGSEYKLHCDWETFGKPEYLFTDGGSDFRSNHIAEVASQLGIITKLRSRPSEGGIVERFFGTLNKSLFCSLPGYTESNTQKRSKEVDRDACLTLRELEQLIVQFIVDNYNQSIDARMGNQTRFQRWDAGLNREPEQIGERELDIFLMKQARRKVQRSGYFQFENLIYRGEHLAGYAGETVSLRYDPSDITTILVYRQEATREVFLTRAHAQWLETERLSLHEAQSSARQLRKSGKNISNESVLREVLAREVLLERNKTRRERRKEEQSHKRRAPVE